MAHVAKYNKAQTGQLCQHYERKMNDKGEYVKFGNEDINLEKTPNNYNLAPEHNQIDFIRQRCSEVQCLNRKDVNVMCSWVVTAPKGLPQEQEREFFEQTYKFLEKRYGEKNVISAHVHVDEVTPHMHFAFVPVTYDKKKDIEKVSAKEVITKVDLKTFHTDLEKHLERHFGREVGILNEATKEGNKGILELKKDTAQEELKSIQETIKELQGKISGLQQAREVYRSDLKALQDVLESAKVVKATYYEIDNVESKTGAFNRDKVTISAKDFEKLKEVAKKGVTLEHELECVKGDVIRLKNRENRVEKLAKDLKSENVVLKTKTFSMNKENMILKGLLKKTGVTDKQIENLVKSVQEKLQAEEKARQQAIKHKSFGRER